ncbi:hypothetical protein N7517_005390 [Penicillium concentricum]|uniref:Uncharacterized protein n=1 Tax=Penicillium concentricum TaxID=293559 RepID=A0A9W9SA29_9EURO|nr:uncharacterized protein N7517_005390 [Penicillium concentricum]KAJ5373384.1 hypothetical protein N7517_005390 [Penicillium concentricum]
MAQKLDLGGSTLQIRDSKLQLGLAASAHFSQPPRHETPQTPIDVSHLPNLEGVWITEAPELKLRFFVRGNWDRNEAAAFVSKLRGKLCDMEIWSDVGFSVELKTGAREYCIDTSGFHCLELGLRRECKMRNSTTGRALPSSMTNPPDARPPTGVPVATLASIDVQLEYIFQPRRIPQVQEYFKLKVGLLGQESSTFCSPRLLETMADVAILQREDPTEIPGSQSSCISGDESDPSCEELFRLFNLGVQRLFISNSIKDPTIRVPQQVTIKSLAGISPAVFDPGYRDAMNQRGVTIPIITKAISSMLAGNNDPSIKTKLADLLELTRSHHTDDTTIQPQFLSFRAAVLSSLWRVAQEAVPKIKPTKRRASVFSTECLSNRLAVSDEAVRRISTDQLQLDSGNSALTRSIQTLHRNENEESDVCLLNSESDDQLLDNLSETSFPDIGEWTQTSINTLSSTIGSSQTSCGDHDAMLFSNNGELVDYPGNYVTDYDSREDMEAYDIDIIMAHDL